VEATKWRRLLPRGPTWAGSHSRDSSALTITCARVDDRLRVIRLMKRAVGRLHDLGVRIGEVALRGRLGRKRVTTAGRVARLAALGAHRFAARLFTLLGLGLKLRLRLAQPGQARVAAREFCGQLVAAHVGAVELILGRIGRLSLSEQRSRASVKPRDLSLQLRLLLGHPLIGHRLARRDAFARSFVPSSASDPN